MLDARYFFPCPNCGETIGSDFAACRYCNSPIDPAAASLAIKLQQQINHACNEASIVRNVAGFTWVVILLHFLFLATDRLLYVGAVVTVPFWLAHWWLKYGRIQTSDVDFKAARRNWKIALLLWAPIPLLVVIVLTLVR